MDDVIRRAIEGGLGEGRQATAERLPQIILKKFGGEILLLPDFWQSVGKAMGWDQEVCKLCHNGWTYKDDKNRTGTGAPLPNIKNSSTACDYSTVGCPWGQEQWRYQWHRFIDHLADGGNVDDFFKDF